MKSQQDCIKFYNMVKEQVPYIRFTYTDYKLYKNRNLYYDWSFYNELYFNKQKSIFKHADLTNRKKILNQIVDIL